MLSDISMRTIVLTVGISVVTSYFGTLLNYHRLRDRQRRTYGLAILSEIKSLQRVFRLYHGLLGSEPVVVRVGRLPRLTITTADLNVFTFNAGNIGLFSVRTAVEVIDFYSRVRALISYAKELEDARAANAADDVLELLLLEHLRAVVQVRGQSRAVAALLRNELPPMWDERMRYVRRKLRLRLIVVSRRLRQAVSFRRVSAPPAVDFAATVRVEQGGNS